MKFRLKPQHADDGLAIKRPFAIFFTPPGEHDEDDPNWMAQVIGPDGLDNYAFASDPVVCAFMAADLIHAITNTCIGKDTECGCGMPMHDELVRPAHDWSVEAEMEDHTERAIAAVACSHCGWKMPITYFTPDFGLEDGSCPECHHPDVDHHFDDDGTIGCGCTLGGPDHGACDCGEHMGR